MNIQNIIESLMAITELSPNPEGDDYIRGYRDALESIHSLTSESVSSSSSVSGRLSSENPRFPARSDEYAIATINREEFGEGSMTDEQWDRFKELLNQESFDDAFDAMDMVLDDCYARATGESPEDEDKNEES